MTPDELRARAEANKPAPGDVEVGPDGQIEDHPLDAIKYGEAHKMDMTLSILAQLPQQDKEKLLKMCKHGQFNKKESAVIKYLLLGAGNLEDLSVMFGAVSPQTKGEPMSKVAAFNKLQEIIAVIAKRSKVKLGKEVDLNRLKDFKKAMKERNALLRKQSAEKRRQKAQEKRDQAAAMKEFWKTLYELNQEQRAKGLPVSRYGKFWTQQHGGSADIDRAEGRYDND